MRAQASTDSSIVTQLRSGQVITVLSESNGWAQVRTQDNEEGYVSSEFLIDRVTGTVVNINSALNVRATASATGRQNRNSGKWGYGNRPGQLKFPVDAGSASGWENRLLRLRIYTDCQLTADAES